MPQHRNNDSITSSMNPIISCKQCGQLVRMGDQDWPLHCPCGILHYKEDSTYTVLKEGEIPPPRPTFVGPGTCLHRILFKLGISPDKCNGDCAAMLRRMDRLGPLGCIQHKDEIIRHLNKAYKKIGTLALPSIAAKALRSGLIFKIHPVNRAESLLDLAIQHSLETRAKG